MDTARRPLSRPRLAGAACALALLAGACGETPVQPEPGPRPAAVEALRGDDQQAEPGVLLRDSIAVRVLDSGGAPLAGASVGFVVVAGGGAASPATVRTDGQGVARAAWTLGAEPGEQRLEARAGSAPAAAFRARARVPEPFPAAPNPRHVSPALADGAVAVEIPVTGGQLSATGPDGTVYTLAVPGGALLLPTTIRMTPLAAVGNLGMSGGLVAGVQLEPSGLKLNLPATLTVEPARPPDGARLTGFAYRGAGAELRLHALYPADVHANRFTLRVSHFSGYGAGSATAADRDAQRQAHPPTEPADQLAQRVADEVQRLRACELGGDSCDRARLEEELHAVAALWWERLVRPALIAARGDCRGAAAANGEYVAWARQVELLELEGFEARVAEGEAHVIAILDNCVDEAFERCTAQNDMAQLQVLTGLARAKAFLQGEAAAEPVMEKVDRCASFELEFEMLLGIEAYGENWLELHVRARTPLSALHTATPPEGWQAPIEVVAVRPGRFAEGCSHTIGAVQTSPLVVLGTEWTMDPVRMDTATALPAEKASFSGIGVHFAQGSVHFTVDYACPDGDGGQLHFPVDMSPYFRDGYRLLHPDEQQAADTYLTAFRPGEIPAGSLFARRTYQGRHASGQVVFSENTAFTLWHRPR